MDSPHSIQYPTSLGGPLVKNESGKYYHVLTVAATPLSASYTVHIKRGVWHLPLSCDNTLYLPGSVLFLPCIFCVGVCVGESPERG